MLRFVEKSRMRLHLSRLLSLLTILAGLFLSNASFSVPSSDDLVKDVLKQTNKFRKSQGLDELEMREDLNRIAQKHSENMASGRSRFGHSGFAQRQVMVGRIIRYKSMSENVAYGARDAKQAVDMWKDSPGHRSNMAGNYTYIGIGVARNKQGFLYYTQIFVR